jgi:hypothetical protein
MRKKKPKEQMAFPMSDDDLFTAPEVARFCKVDLKTIHNWVDRQQIEHFRTPGRHLPPSTRCPPNLRSLVRSGGPAARTWRSRSSRT